MVHAHAGRLQELLGLRSPPVAIAFQAKAPAGIPRVDAPAPSGCTYWKEAAAGRTFYTEAQDHYHCPVGAFTHGIELPSEQAQELHQVLDTMFSLGYLRREEIPAVPRRQEAFGVAVFAPFADAPFDPDVVLVRGNARQIMLLNEAAQAAGIDPVAELRGRPTCAAIPEALAARRGVASLGCIGNRVYTGLADDELYFAIPGKLLDRVIEKLATVVEANRQLENYHRARMLALT